MKCTVTFLTCIVAVTLGCGTANEESTIVASVGHIAVQDPFAPEPVTPDVGSLYFTMRNSGDVPDSLMSVSVDAAADVTLHDSGRTDDAPRMVSVASIEIPAHGSVALEPGGYHAMLRELQHHYREGEFLNVTAHFARAGTLSFRVPVISYADVADHMRHGHSEDH